ncbi:hypothetical protein N0V90_008311 [Kalmusia sp. IMI 367209]|nr:hypothetical protein N0V90_008311 [Kalmusia sp. IMI 367209]
MAQPPENFSPLPKVLVSLHEVEDGSSNKLSLVNFLAEAENGSSISAVRSNHFFGPRPETWIESESFTRREAEEEHRSPVSSIKSDQASNERRGENSKVGTSCQPESAADALLGRLASKRGSLDRKPWDIDFDYRTLVARKVSEEVNDELRDAHEALMRCLYSPITMGAGVNGEQDRKEAAHGFKWTPSMEQLRTIYEINEDGDEEEERGRSRERRDGIERDQTTLQVGALRMRGGGLQERLGPKCGLKQSDSRHFKEIQRSQGVFRPLNISRDSSGFFRPTADHSTRRLQKPGAASSSRKLLQLQQLQRLDRLAQPSFNLKDNSSSLTDSFGSYLVADSSNVESWLSRPDHKEDEQPLVHADFAQLPPPLTSEGRNKPLPRKPSRSESRSRSRSQSEGSVRTVRGETSPTQSRTTVWRRPGNIVDDSFDVPPGSSRNVRNNVLGAAPNKYKERSPQRELGSPMQFPDRMEPNSWNDYGASFESSIGDDSTQVPFTAGWKKPQGARQGKYFAPFEISELGRRALESLRKNRDSTCQTNSDDNLASMDGQTAGDMLFAPGSLKTSPIDQAMPWPLSPSIDDPAESRTLERERSGGTIWQGGSYSSIAPEDSTSQVSVGQDQQTRHDTNKIVPNQNFTEVGEQIANVGRVEENSEKLFRDRVKTLWDNYQTRLRMLHDDVAMTPEGKMRRAKEEHTMFEALMDHASTDTGYEKMHGSWQQTGFIEAMLGTQSSSSRTPYIIRKLNKVMKWILAVPDDPEAKTFSSRKHGPQFSSLGVGSSSLQRKVTDPPGSRAAPSSVWNRPGQRVPYDHQAKSEQLYFAPGKTFHAHMLQQSSFRSRAEALESTLGQTRRHNQRKQASSTASSQTGWPHLSQADAK